MRELSAGDDAVVLDFAENPDPSAAAQAAAVLRTARAEGRLIVDDVVPSAFSVLVQAAPGTGLDLLGVRRALREAARGTVAVASVPAVTIPVHYDGDDLAEVAALAGVDELAVVDAHTAIEWRVQFMGFAPGFGYLVPAEDSSVDAVRVFASITRRSQSRPAVPTGSVAVSAGYSAIYPRVSPGGWFLLGHTDIAMWDAEREPPALLAAGTSVRFVCAD